MSKAAITKCSEYEYGKVKKALEKAIGLLGGIEKFVKPEQKVLLKVNLIEPMPPEKGACTHPMIVKAMIEMVKEITPNVWVGDAAGSTEENTTEKAFNVSGISAVIKETGAVKKNFQKSETIEIEVENGKHYKKIPIFRPVAEADVIINMPKLKTHGVTFYTGAVKNMFGCVPGKFRQTQHKKLKDRQKFSQALVDVFIAKKPSLNVMDAIQAMQGDNGPSYGPLYKLGLIIASEDAVALDAIASEVIGYNAMSIPTTQKAFEREVGEGRIEKIEIAGEKLEECKVKDFELSSLFSKKEFKKSKVFNPTVEKEKCIKCKSCKINCPVKAIKLKPFPIFDREKCIHCFVCMEVCQGEAIKLVEQKSTEKRLDLKVGYKCNNNCMFCVIAEKREQGNKTTEEIKKDLKLARKSGTAQIVFTGGEPTIRPDLIELVKYAKEIGFEEIQIQSNGRMFCYMDFCKKLVNAGVTEFGPALHGADAKTHDSLTKSPGSFEQTIQGIKNLVGLNQKVIMNSVITKQNFRQLPKIVELFANLKVHQAQLAFVHPMGNAGKEFDKIVPSFKEAMPYIYKAIEKAKNKGLRLMVEAVPLCLMQGYEQFSSEQYIPETEIREIEGFTPNFTKARKEEGKRKGPKCRECRYFLVCEGPWKEYPEKKGFSEFIPVKGKKIKSLKELACLHPQKNRKSY